LGDQLGFQVRDGVETPGGVGEFLDELGFGGSGGSIFVEELTAVELIGGGVLGSEDRGTAGEAVGEGILGRALFAGGGTGSGGEQRVRAVGASARLGGWGLGIGDWRGSWICHRASGEF
jgi:hypothetical protein